MHRGIRRGVIRTAVEERKTMEAGDVNRAEKRSPIAQHPLFEHAARHSFVHRQTLDRDGPDRQRRSSISYAPRDPAGVLGLARGPETASLTAHQAAEGVRDAACIRPRSTWRRSGRAF